LEKDKSNLDDYIDKKKENISLKKSNEVSNSFKTIGVLSIIGSSLWIILWIMGFSYISDFFKYANDSFIRLITFVVLLLIIFNVIKIIGISQMFKQKSLGFILYIVFNIIHTGFILYSYFNGSEQNQLILLFALLSVVFIILVTTNKDKVMNQ
tara:strand:- start:4015 stop:4473 length:459 start_codon:yes stop_codon:yes gene_type:complete